jgi:hypothetical protein
LKAVREKKQITYKGKPIKISADFSMETLKARGAWSEVFQALNENNFNPENESKQNHERTGNTKPQEKERQGFREQH